MTLDSTGPNDVRFDRSLGCLCTPLRLNAGECVESETQPNRGRNEKACLKNPIVPLEYLVKRVAQHGVR